MPVYDDFVQLMDKANPNLAGKLPSNGDAALNTLGVKGLIGTTRQIFVNDPSLADKMIIALNQSKADASDAKKYRLLKSYIKLYSGPNRRYINFYGPPRTVTTIPFYQALQLGQGPVEGQQIVKGKVVFVGLSEVMLAERKDSFYTVFSQANGIFVRGWKSPPLHCRTLSTTRP